MNKNMSARMNLAAVLAAALGAFGGRLALPQISEPKQRKRVPTMVTASPEEIAAWNDKVDALKQLHFHQHKFKRTKPTHDSGQHPKFAKVRVHKQHKHTLRDEHGAYTLTGSTYEMQAAPGKTIDPSSREHVFGGAFGDGGHAEYTARRKWLAGISAQRGY